MLITDPPTSSKIIMFPIPGWENSGSYTPWYFYSFLENLNISIQVCSCYLAFKFWSLVVNFLFLHHTKPLLSVKMELVQECNMFLPLILFYLLRIELKQWYGSELCNQLQNLFCFWASPQRLKFFDHLSTQINKGIWGIFWV